VTAYQRLVDALERHGSTVRRNGTGAMAQCPAHEDRNPSLSIAPAREFAGAVTKCQAGCGTDDVLGAIGFTTRDLFDEPRDRSTGYAVVAEYPYVNEAGVVLFVQERRFPKDFRVKRPNGTGWTYGLGDTRRVLYRLPEVLAAVNAGLPVWLVEGERDADRLAALGVTATISPLGAGKWRPEYGDTLAGAHVVLVADDDPAGYAHARTVAADLTGKAATVRVVKAATGKDVSDHVAAGHTLDDLVPVTPVDGLPGHGDHDDHDAEVERALAYARAVQDEAYKIRVREDARVLVTAERAAQAPAPPFDAGTLGEVLARPAEPAYRVDQLIAANGSVLIVAARKTGKTTMKLNLTQSLLTGEPFLGRFDVRPIDGSVAFLNYEVSGGQLARWADDVGIDRDRLFLVNLRGRRNPLGNVEDRERLVELLRARDVSILIVDPFGRAYTGASQNDPGEVGAWLAELDRFAADVGATETVLAAHAGWNGERTRGSSALEDWADSIVTLVRDPDDDSQRFLRAIGRDVEVEEDRLTFDPATRLLRLSGTGSRKVVAVARKIDGLVESVVEVVTETPGLNIDKITRELRSREIGFRTHEPSRAAARAVEQGLLVVRQEGRAKLHYPPTLPTLPDTSRGGVNASLPTLSIGEGCIERDTEPSSLPAPTTSRLDRCPHHNQPLAPGIGCFECARRAATS